jgi:hypothetical protein
MVTPGKDGKQTWGIPVAVWVVVVCVIIFIGAAGGALLIMGGGAASKKSAADPAATPAVPKELVAETDVRLTVASTKRSFELGSTSEA